MQFHHLRSACARRIASMLCAGFLLACSADAEAPDDSADAGAKLADDQPNQNKQAASAATSKTASGGRAADPKTDAGPAADSGKREQDANQAAEEESAKGNPPQSQPDKKDAPADKPAGKNGDSQDKAPESLKVSIRFQAKLGKTDFGCSHKYPSQGTANTTVTPSDLRLFVHGLELIKEDGSKASVTLNPRESWQSESLALLDFEDKTGRCVDGTPGTNTAITGTVAPGTYKGIRFIVGVPDELSHGDPATAAEPLKSATGLGPKGSDGYRFAKIGILQLSAAATAMGSGLIELGSSQCSAASKCDRVNRSIIELDAFDLEKNSIVIDIAALFSQLDLTQANECHSTEKSCDPMFSALGVNFVTGESKPGQTLFRVE